MTIDEAIAAATEAGWLIEPVGFEGETCYSAWAPSEQIQLSEWTSDLPPAAGVYRWRAIHPRPRNDDTLWCNVDISENFDGDVEFQHATLKVA